MGPIFQELEAHQVTLQAMQSSSAAGSFLDEVLKWQKRLQTIKAVLTGKSMPCKATIQVRAYPIELLCR